jgi:hypothetical protein
MRKKIAGFSGMGSLILIGFVLYSAEPCACLKLKTKVDFNLTAAACMLRKAESSCQVSIEKFYNISELQSAVKNCNLDYQDCFSGAAGIYGSTTFQDSWGRNLILNSKNREICTWGEDGESGHFLWNPRDKDFCKSI